MAHVHQKGSNAYCVAVRRLVSVWALLGGGLLLAVVAVNMFSVIGSIFGSPFPGDFELTEMGVAIAAFAFLPYCQTTGANVTADIFTDSASPRWIAILTLVGALIALLCSIILIWRMYAGMLDQKTYNYLTAILQIPQWTAYLPILISLVLLALAAIVTTIEETSTIKNGNDHV